MSANSAPQDVLVFEGYVEMIVNHSVSDEENLRYFKELVNNSGRWGTDAITESPEQERG